LPEAQLDRFLMRVSFGYPNAEEENEVLQRRLERQREEQTLNAISDPATVVAMQRTIETVTVDRTISRYCVDLSAATRTQAHIMVGASPRGALGLLLAARSLAVIRGRDYVVPEDVKAVAHPVLAHRLTLKPELWMTAVTAHSVVDAVLGTVPAPSARERV
jgi:MoxR-like ATPase